MMTHFASRVALQPSTCRLARCSPSVNASESACAGVICSLFVQRFTWRRILHLLRSATRPFCSLFVQQMRSCPSAESVHQTHVFSVLLAFPSLVNGWTNRF